MSMSSQLQKECSIAVEDILKERDTIYSRTAKMPNVIFVDYEIYYIIANALGHSSSSKIKYLYDLLIEIDESIDGFELRYIDLEAILKA